MIALEIVAGKDRPLKWSLEHSSGHWAFALVSEDASIEDMKTRQWQSSRTALQHLRDTAGLEDLTLSLGLDVAKEPSGRPYVPDSSGYAIPVALAHTLGMGAAALPRRRVIAGIGVDVERLSERFLRVWSRIASHEDWKLVCDAGLNRQEALAAALIWVIKEACYKAALDQQSLFGHNQSIKSIEEHPLKGHQGWAGQVICLNANPVEIIDFEAGIVPAMLGGDNQPAVELSGFEMPIQETEAPQLKTVALRGGEGQPWIWAVAWING
jgi:phosphopantetheinyl transferase